MRSVDELTNRIEIKMKFSSSYKTIGKRDNSNFSLMKMNNTLTIKQKHNIEVNFQTEKHYSKHIESNTPVV